LLKAKEGSLAHRAFGGFWLADLGLEVGKAGEEDEAGEEDGRE
jgi:hypothetical protein